jgi:hypothetical protein
MDGLLRALYKAAPSRTYGEEAYIWLAWMTGEDVNFSVSRLRAEPGRLRVKAIAAVRSHPMLATAQVVARHADA